MMWVIKRGRKDNDGNDRNDDGKKNNENRKYTWKLKHNWEMKRIIVTKAKTKLCYYDFNLNKRH